MAKGCPLLVRRRLLGTWVRSCCGEDEPWDWSSKTERVLTRELRLNCGDNLVVIWDTPDVEYDDSRSPGRAGDALWLSPSEASSNSCRSERPLGRWMVSNDSSIVIGWGQELGQVKSRQGSRSAGTFPVLAWPHMKLLLTKKILLNILDLREYTAKAQEN